MLELVLIAAVVIVGVYVLLLAAVWSQQERIVFQPPSVHTDEPPDYTGDELVRQVSYRAEDGAALFGYVVGDLSRARGVLIAFHGNADLARYLVPWAVGVVRTARVAVLLPELRGYGGIAGQPTYAGAAQDARAALGFVRDSLGIAEDRVAFFGHSLGSALATELAAEHHPRALLLQSPFTSARAMARRMLVPGTDWLWSLISRVHYDTERRVHRLPVAVWVAHGERDLIIPVSMGRTVFERAANKGDFLLVPGAGHNDVPERGGEAYWDWLRRALAW